MTKQEMLDKVWQVFVVEKTPLNIYRDNVYYSAKGNNVGDTTQVLVSDFHFEQWMEGMSLTYIQGNSPKFKEAIKDLDFSLLAALQQWHDEFNDSSKEGIGKLNDLAKMHGLKVNNEI